MEQPPLGLTKPIKIYEVIDGDTVKGKIEIDVTIRLDGYDAPEIRQPKTPEEKQRGVAAKQFLKSIISGDAVLHVPFTEQQRFVDITTLGRVIGRVFVDGKDISELMVKEGHTK